MVNGINKRYSQIEKEKEKTSRFCPEGALQLFLKRTDEVCFRWRNLELQNRGKNLRHHGDPEVDEGVNTDATEEEEDENEFILMSSPYALTASLLLFELALITGCVVGSFNFSYADWRTLAQA